MKTVFSFPVDELRGKAQNLGEYYFRTTGGIRVFQRGRNNSPPQTPALAFTQDTFAASMAAWNALADNKKVEWNTWVATEKALSLDQEQQISGMNAYRSMWQISTGGRISPRVSGPSAETTSRLGNLNEYGFRTGPGRWFISVFSEAAAELQSLVLFEVSTPNASEAVPYRKEDLALVQKVDIAGSLVKTTQADRWSLWVDYPTKTPVVGHWVWVRATLWSPSWWPADQRIYHAQLIST